ncbi:unnamed protein product, partial [Effrenium voratum]
RVREKGIKHGISSTFILDASEFMCTDKRQRLDADWQVAVLNQDLDAKGAVLNKQRVSEKYLRPLFVCQYYMKNLEHKFKCAGSLAYQRLKIAMQNDSCMRTQVLAAVNSGKKINTLREVALLEQELKAAAEEAQEASRKSAQAQLQADEQATRLKFEEEKRQAAAAAKAAGYAEHDMAIDLVDAFEEADMDADVEAEQLAAAAAAQKKAAEEEARVKGMIAWDRITRHTEMECVQE